MERKTARKRRKDCTVGESAEMKGGDVMKARMQVLLEHWQVEETKRLSEAVRRYRNKPMPDDKDSDILCSCNVER